MENSEYPANPCPMFNKQGFQNGQFEGLTKREYFTGLAMSVVISKTVHPATFFDAVKLFLRKFGIHYVVTFNNGYDVPSDAKQCVYIADEILKQLEQN